jgi:hypothetical protein
LLNYGRCIAKISLHFKSIPIHLDEEQINGYLQHLLLGQKPSRSYFKHTVYGLRFLFRMHDLEDRIIKLPTIKRDNKLPVGLSTQECKTLFAAGRILKKNSGSNSDNSSLSIPITITWFLPCLINSIHSA